MVLQTQQIHVRVIKIHTFIPNFIDVLLKAVFNSLFQTAHAHATCEVTM